MVSGYRNMGKLKDVIPCRICKRLMCGEIAFHSGERRGAVTHHGGRGLCRPCYIKVKRRHERIFLAPRPKKVKAPPSPIIKFADLIDDYQMIKGDVRTIREAAERMGVSFRQLDMALYRARKRGDERANAPVPQRLRAAERGVPFGREGRAA